jgi:hypothetical protein
MLMRICPDCKQTSEAWEVVCHHCGFPDLQSEGIEVEVDKSSENQGSSHSSDLNKFTKTSTPSSPSNILAVIKNKRVIVLGLTLTVAISAYLYFSREKTLEANATDNSQLAAQETPEDTSDNSPVISEDNAVFEAPPEETNVEKAIRVTSENQHHFTMSAEMTMTDFFEDRQRENAKTDPSMTISGFKWVGESLSDNPNKVKVEYQSYPTAVTCRWYWLVDLSTHQISIMDSNQDGYAFKTLSFTPNNVSYSSSTASNQASTYWYKNVSLNESHLEGKSAWELLVMRNEIVARHGRSFTYKPLQSHFNSQTWYQINPGYSTNMLTPIERNNMETILQYEKKMDYM